MSSTPSIRTIRDALHEQARAARFDPIDMEALRADVVASVRSVRESIDRAMDFWKRGLASEMTSVVEDFPDLVHAADALQKLPGSDPAVAHIWTGFIDIDGMPLGVPTAEEVESLAAAAAVASRHRELLDALRVAVLRREPVEERLGILKRIRAADPKNRVWLEQIEGLEREWLREIAEMRGREATREELERAFAALSGGEWIATVPRGLKEEIYAKLRPLRVEEAASRYDTLAEEIHSAASMMDRAALVRLEAEWADIHASTGRMPSDELMALVAPAFEWLNALAAEDAAAASFAGLVDALERSMQERQPAVEVGRRLAFVRDAGRSAPEGLVARAVAYVDAERDRLRRRHRLTLFASACAALAVSAAGFFAIRAYNATDVRRQTMESLRALLEAKDVQAAHRLAEEIRARGGDADAETAALLAAEAELFQGRQTRIEEIRSALKGLAAELASATRPTRARLAAIGAELASLAKDPDESDKPEIARLVALRDGLSAELDAADARRVDEALAKAASTLKDWPLPNKWTDAQQLDPARWKAYLQALKTSGADLEAAQGSIKGLESGERKIRAEIDRLAELSREAEGRSAELAAALAALAPDRISTPFSSEAQFIERLEKMLAEHGAVLARQRVLADFESARDFKQAWLAIGAWREDFRPRLAASLGRDLATRPAAEQEGSVLAVLQQFLSTHPAAPFRRAVEKFSASFEPSGSSATWDVVRARTALSDTKYVDLDAVPLSSGRWFYRRPAPRGSKEAGADARHRAVKTLDDLLADPDRLSSILLPAPTAVVGKPEPSGVSVAWKRAQDAMGSAQPGGVSPVMLDLLRDLASVKVKDELFQFRALHDATQMLLLSGHCPPEVEKPLRAWQDSLPRDAAEALRADWLAASYAPEIDFRKERSEASRALAKFPKLDELITRAMARRQADAASLDPLEPFGVLMPASQPGGSRRIPGVAYTGTVVLVVRDVTGFALLELDCRGGEVLAPSDQVSKGPVIAYRRRREG